eukprot:jgi/Botrbrau1/1757/Bobra.0217s0013.1
MNTCHVLKRQAAARLVHLLCIALALPAGHFCEEIQTGDTTVPPGLTCEEVQTGDSGPPTLHISSFKDIEEFFLGLVKDNLTGILDVQVKYVKNANEAHGDLKSGAADLVYMSYDDTLSMALLEDFDDVLAAWPVHYSMMNLCGTIDVAKGLTHVGIDTDTGYARMLRNILKKNLSSDDYSKINWVYAGGTNLRYEQLVAGTLNATLLNQPFISQLPASTPCQPFWKETGPIQGTVGNIRASSVQDGTTWTKLRTFLQAFKRIVLEFRDSPSDGATVLGKFYNVDPAVAEAIYAGLWGVDGLSTTFCFEDERLKNVENIFSTDTGVSVPAGRWWVKDLGCGRLSCS